MIPASTKGGGQCAGFPDVCKVPAPPAPFVPTPFMNIAEVSSSVKTCAKVLIKNKETVCENSEIPSSKGDEPGTLKGMLSMTNMSKVTYKTASASVYAGGKKIIHVGAVTSHNGAPNANMPAGVQTTPSQTDVLVAF